MAGSAAKSRLQQPRGGSEKSPDSSGSGATGAEWSGSANVNAPPDQAQQGTASGTGGLTATDTSDQTPGAAPTAADR